MSKRLECNEQILQHLYRIAKENPDLRFHQLLSCVDVLSPNTDLFYEESEETLRRMEANPLTQLNRSGSI